ncbi:MAG: hypothetical protein Q8N47_20495 [Bryobacterales bacterium]|nr:hypothetical protein [Bryobacterales bacterium]
MSVTRIGLLTLTTVGICLGADDSVSQARQLEAKGDALGARAALERAVRGPSAGAGALAAWAEFLDRRKEPGARPAYERALAGAASPEERRPIARRLVVLALLDDDHLSAIRHLEAYRSAGGADFSAPPPVKKQSAEVEQRAVIEIPGPLRSFSRMAALSPDLAPEELLPALARNVVTNGYQASSGAESLDQTEYLKLVIRYLSQARELTRLAGESKQIRIETCESAQTGDLLRTLGYRMRGGCGSEVVLDTVNASRAFLTIDSGFPLAELEQALRTSRPFNCDYRPTQVPVVYGSDYWLGASKEKQSGEFIDQFLGDPSICRLYLGLSKLDRETADGLRKAIAVQRIRAFAHVLDFFGGMFQIRNGKAIVPGAPRATAMWNELVGASPDQGAQFFERLISRDDGWMASYFDSLARIHGPVKDYLTEPARMKRFYQALRGRVTSPGPARPVFRSNTDLMLLTTRLRVGADGKPRIPGGVDVWKNLFVNHPHGKYDGKLTRAATGWKEPDDVVEALFALCRKAVENEPLKIFLALSDMDRRRETPLEAATVNRLAREWRLYASQYAVLNETGALADKTVIQYLDTAAGITQIRDAGLRADAAGTLQALVGLWQIFVRQESIRAGDTDAALSGILGGFAKVRNSRELFDAGHAGVAVLLKTTGSAAGASGQDRLMDLLSGAGQTGEEETRTQVIQDMMRVFEAQRLVSLKTIFDLTDHLESLSQGEKLNTQLVSRLASRIGEVQLPRMALSGAERNAFAFGYWTERHIDAQRKLNLRALIDRAAGDPEKLKDIRGQLAGVLRDTLVGLNYVYYAPPGAQILLTNPVFVRSHDFIGVQGSAQTWRNTEVFGSGWPSSAGGRLVGSLAGLPYALAEAEQNFLVPSREQALIWGDLVPQMIQSAKIPRWWRVTPQQMHFVGLHLRYGETLLAESVLDLKRREQVLAVLDRQAPPARVRRVADLLAEGRVGAASEFVTPSEFFVLASAMLPAAQSGADPLAAACRQLMQDDPERVSYAAISRAFGTPKPTLANTYRPELLNLRTFPTLMGFSSRIMAEGWESNILYYASLADELHLGPGQLNVLIPEWTRKTVERIFATHLEDWPALLRSLRRVGDDERVRIRKLAAEQQKTSMN